MKCRQHESGGFSGAGLRTDQQVVSGHGRRNGLGLDGGGFGVTGESESVQERFVKAKFSKCHQCLSNGSASRDHTEVAHGRRKCNANQRNSDEKLRRRGEFETFRHKKALCQGGVQDNDTKRQEGFGNAARFAKRVRIAMLLAIEGAEYIRSRWWEVIAFVVFS